MPYYSSNTSDSGVARGGVSHRGAKRYSQSGNDIAALAAMLESIGGFNNNNSGPSASDASLMAALGLDPNVPFDIQGIPGTNLLGDTPAKGHGIPAMTQADRQAVLPGTLLQPKQGKNPSKGGQTNMLDQLFGQLVGSVQAGGPNQADFEQALNDAAAQIKKAYAHEVGAVKIANSGARKDTQKGNKQIRAMYRALSKNYHRGAKQEIKSGKSLAHAMQGVANDATNTVENVVSKQLDQQAALARGLGVQDALPSVAAGQTKQANRNVTNIQKAGQRAANDTLTYSGNQQRFLDRGGKNALLEGTNRRADLISQLQDYLNANRSKIADIRGQKFQALAANEAKMSGDFANAQSTAQDDAFKQLMELANLKLSIDNARAGNKLDRQKFLASLQSGTSGGGGSAGDPFSNYPDNMKNIAGLAAGTPNPKLLMSILTSLMNSPQFRQNRFKTKGGDVLKMTPNEAAFLAEQELKKRGITDPKMLAAARYAAMQMVG